MLSAAQFLHAHTISGMPPHQFKLQVEIVVTLVRNLNSEKDYAVEQDYVSRECMKILEEQEF
jgi:hypothetical protein